MSNPHPIHTEAEYDAANARITALINKRPSAARDAELEAISIFVAAYEAERYPIALDMDAVAFLAHAMELTGRTQSDLADVLGSRSRASEILNRQRPLALDHIRALVSAWKLPAEPLLRQCVA